jgi:hypothetical protein
MQEELPVGPRGAPIGGSIRARGQGRQGPLPEVSSEAFYEDDSGKVGCVLPPRGYHQMAPEAIREAVEVGCHIDNYSVG